LVETTFGAIYHLTAMTTLGLETAEAIGGAAVWGDGGLLAEMWLERPLEHAEGLVPLIERLLASCDVQRGDLRRISVNRGPGSFTGLRIGLATAKGLCGALEVPLIGIDGPAAYRSRVVGEGRVCVVVPDRRDRYYVQRFSATRPLGPVRILTASELEQLLATVRAEEMVVGSGVPRLATVLRRAAERSGGRLRFADEAMTRPSAAAIARLGYEADARDDVYRLEPMYVEPLLARPATR